VGRIILLLLFVPTSVFLLGIGSARSTTTLPALTIKGVSVQQPDSGTTNAVLNVRLSRASSKLVRVHYQTQDGTATAGTDYATAHGTVVFKPEGRRAQITIRVLADTTPEDDESFYVALSSARNARIAQQLATVKIPFNHLPPPYTARATLTTPASATAQGSIVISCDPAASQLSFTLTVSGLPEAPSEVHIHFNFMDPTLFLRPTPPANGSASGTLAVRRTILIQLYENPHDWVTAVHIAPDYPAWTLAGYFSRP
jgi:hypothetical protein